MSSKRTRGSEDGDFDELSPSTKAAKSNEGDEQRKIRRATLKVYLTALNEQFSSWIKEQLSEHVEELWTDGVRDYLDHADKMVKDFKDVLIPEPAASENPAPPKSVSFGGASTITSSPLFGAEGLDKPFGAPTSTAAAESPKPAAGNIFGSSNPFAFGAAASTPAATSTSSAAPASPSKAAPSTEATGAPAPAPGFFSLPSSSSTAASGSTPAPSTGNIFGQPGGALNFGQPATNFFGGGGAFSFGGAPAAGGGNQADCSGAAAEEEEEAPQKYESEVVTNSESGVIVYKAKAKMSHYKREDTADGKPTWDSKGMGMLMLRAPKDPAGKPFITFTTEAGRVLYIANLSKTMKTIMNDSSNTLSWSAPWAPTPEQAPSLQMVRFQLGKGKHLGLKTEIEKVQEKME